MKAFTFVEGLYVEFEIDEALAGPNHDLFLKEIKMDAPRTQEESEARCWARGHDWITYHGRCMGTDGDWFVEISYQCIRCGKEADGGKK